MLGLKYYRRRADLTQEQFAEMLGVQRGAVSMWEIGKSWPSAALLPKIADLLLCSIDDLYHVPDFTDKEDECPCLNFTEICTEGTAALQA